MMVLDTHIWHWWTNQIDGALTQHHKDPQDRIIIATALIHRADLMSFDSQFPAYQELNHRLITR